MAPDPSDERYEQARKRVEAKMGFFSHLAVFIIINIVFLIVAGADWLWVTLFWGIFLALHAWRVFFSDSGAVAAWKEKQIQKELDRGQTPAESEAGAAAAPAAAQAPEAAEPPPTAGDPEDTTA